jgi:hypothetical protein
MSRHAGEDVNGRVKEAIDDVADTLKDAVSPQK